MVQKERWNLQNIPSELKQEIIKLGKEKGFTHANDFIAEILSQYLEDQNLGEHKHYFDQRWQEVIESFQFFASVQNKNTEQQAAQDLIFHEDLERLWKELQELKLHVGMLATIQQMHLGYNAQESKKFAALYQKFFETPLPNQSEVDWQNKLDQNFGEEEL